MSEVNEDQGLHSYRRVPVMSILQEYQKLEASHEEFSLIVHHNVCSLIIIYEMQHHPQNRL